MDVDELYGLPLERFTPERNALARELRRAGERERATEVAALRKPSVAAWAVNQLIRTQRRAIGELFEAGDALREAQDAVLGGRGDGGSLRVAAERERLAVEALTEAARGLLTSDGHELSPTIVDRVSDTLHAAALDDDARGQVADGRIERELRHVGLGAGAGSPAPAGGQPAARKAEKPAGGKPAARKAEKPGARDADKPGARKADKRAAGKAGKTAEKPSDAAKKRDAERAMRERAQAQAQARAAARVAEREARRRVERADRGAELARERRDRAAAALEQAETELSESESELREAKAELQEAERGARDAAA